MKSDYLRAALIDRLLAVLVALALVFALASAKAEPQSPIEFVLAEAARAHPLHGHGRHAGLETGGPRRAGLETGGPRLARRAAFQAHFAGPVAALLASSAARNRVPLHVARAIMTIESRGRCTAHSPANARGAMQVLPSTARSVGVHGNLYDCATGIEAGMRYLRLVISTHGLSCGGLSTYERGIYARPRCTAYGRRAVRLAGL